MSESNLTPGAMRAAERIEAYPRTSPGVIDLSDLDAASVEIIPRKIHIATIIDEETAAPELLEALIELRKTVDQLMPGIGKIACQDYANINEAPILADKAIAKAKGE